MYPSKGFPQWHSGPDGSTVTMSGQAHNGSGKMDGKTDSKNLMNAFNGVKTFSATMAKSRETLGDQVTAWLLSAPDRQVVDTVVTQSSDEAFHCIAITIFYRDSDPLQAAC